MAVANTTRFGKLYLYSGNVYDTKILYTWSVVANMTRYGKRKSISSLYVLEIYTHG